MTSSVFLKCQETANTWEWAGPNTLKRSRGNLWGQVGPFLISLRAHVCVCGGGGRRAGEFVRVREKFVRVPESS